MPKKIVLAYSGGLDTSVILPWLKERYPGVKLVAFAAELGQGDELKGIEKKAYKSGADEVVVKDLRKEFAEQYCFPMLRAHATYEADYLLGTSIARPLIAKRAGGRGPPDRRRRGRPRRHRQGQRPGPLRADLHGARPDAGDRLAVEGSAVPRRRPQRSRDGDRLREKHGIPITAEQEEDLLAGSQPLAHLARGRRDRGSRRASRWKRVSRSRVPPSAGAEQAPSTSRSTFKDGTPVAVNGEATTAAATS